MDFLVGTFRSPILYTIRFTPPSTLQIVATSEACGGHSWLSLSADHAHLYATVWSDPPSIAAYRIQPGHTARLINTKPVQSLSGYTACTATHVFSVGGPTGEVFTIRPDDGGLGDLAQTLSFRRPEELQDGLRAGVTHGNFGGLRHGSHSADLSPDGRSLYVADIGHNCIWTFAVDGAADATEPLRLKGKHVAPRINDGPRHTWPHPKGRVLYSLQEHSCMVDVFAVAEDGTTLEHRQGVKIIPVEKDPVLYWADEVRLSRVDGLEPKYLFASTRGLEAETKGYVAVFELNSEGMILGNAIDIYETPTSGGLANAIEPAPGVSRDGGLEYVALTDSHKGYVSILSFDGKRLRVSARVELKTQEGKVAQAATAVWL